jgi:hypothetical protein
MSEKSVQLLQPTRTKLNTAAAAIHEENDKFLLLFTSTNGSYSTRNTNHRPLGP